MGLIQSRFTNRSDDVSKFLESHDDDDDPGFTIVERKLISMGYDKQLSPKDFQDLAYILSHKEALMQWYLHTDFTKALEMKRKVDMIEEVYEREDMGGNLTPVNQELTSSKGIFNLNASPSHLQGARNSKNNTKNASNGDKSCSSKNSCSGDGSSRDGSNNNNSKGQSSAPQTAPSRTTTRTQMRDEANMPNEEDEFYLKNIYDELNSGSLRIKLIVAETSRNQVEKNIKKLVSPFINLALDNPPEFGFFHIALTIGCWKIEWNNSSLCLPRAITGKSAVIAADIESIATLDRLDFIREKLAEVIVRWNTTMFYQQSPTKSNPNAGNCQHFIDDVLLALGVSDTVKKFPKPLAKYLKQLRMHGKSEMEFAMSKAFRETFNIQEKKMIFKSHEQLDIFFEGLLSQCPDFQYEYKYEYYMLKSFDRAFWMRLKARNGDSMKNCQPLTSSHGEEKCPFGDPTLTSILQFRVKRS